MGYLSNPYLVEDILAPLVRYLREDPVLQELGTLIPESGMNPVLGPPLFFSDQGEVKPWDGSESPWIFRGTAETGAPSANVEGTGSCSITLEYGSPWRGSLNNTTLASPEIKVYYLCDATRDLASGGPIRYDARDKCLSLHKRVRKLFTLNTPPAGDTFHLLGRKYTDESALRVVSSSPGRDLFLQDIPGGDGMIQGQASFEMEVHY